jgi:F-type H+-transporting ATPase subunit a
VIYSLINRGPVKGALHSLKEITVFVSFSFRLFGSILSGLLIMELVYSFIYLSFVVPAALSVVFTLFHAFIQAYVFAMLSSLFLGEAIGEGELDKGQLKKAVDHR